MEEQEWQPVRIAATDGRQHFDISVRGKFTKRHADVVGKIVRVRRSDDYRNYRCGAELIVSVHPEDAEKVLGYLDVGRGCRMCEHQILAD